MSQTESRTERTPRQVALAAGILSGIAVMEVSDILQSDIVKTVGFGIATLIFVYIEARDMQPESIAQDSGEAN